MDGFKNIEIKNFRGIGHLEINDLSRVNVFKYFFRNMDVATPLEVTSTQTVGTSCHLKMGLSYVLSEETDKGKEA